MGENMTMGPMPGQNPAFDRQPHEQPPFPQQQQPFPNGQQQPQFPNQQHSPFPHQPQHGHPQQNYQLQPAPPLRNARALVVTLGIFLVLGLLTGPVAEAVFALSPVRPDESWVLIALALVIMALALVQLGLWVANLVLSIIVVSKGRERIRTGAALALAVTLFGSVFSFDINSDGGTSNEVFERVKTIVMVLSTVFQILMVIVGIVAIVMLVRGIADAKRG